MEEKNFIEQPSQPEGAVPSAETVPDQQVAASQEKQIADLKGLTRTLLGAVQAMQAQSAHNAMVEDLTADVKAATRAMLIAPVKAAVNPSHGERDCCGDSLCCCVSDDCCCFEIMLDRVRAIQPQLEPADSGGIPGFHNDLEVRLFASIDKIGIYYPSFSGTISLDVGSVLLGGKPGLWTPIDRVIGRVCLKKNTVKTIIVDFEAAEIDEGVERPAGMKDEYGYASGSITLDCCTSKIYPAMPTDISFEHLGTGGGVSGMIQVAYYARRVCC